MLGNLLRRHKKQHYKWIFIERDGKKTVFGLLVPERNAMKTLVVEMMLCKTEEKKRVLEYTR